LPTGTNIWLKHLDSFRLGCAANRFLLIPASRYVS
jgi:hypothetical protein